MKRLFLIFVTAALALAQKATTPNPNVQYFNNAGAVCAGCKLYTYSAGGTIFANTYTTASGGAANTNPVVLNSAGRANVWTTPGTSYRFVLCSSAGGASTCSPGGTTYWDVDNIPGGSLIGTSAVTANYVYRGPTSGAPATPVFGPLVAADFTGLFPGITCTNQFVRTASTSLVFTCGTVVGADFGSAVAARAHLGTAASIAAPAMSTTVDALAFQVAEIPSFVNVAADFTTSGVGTSLEAITGLTWTIPANTALTIPFACYLTYSQAVANAAVAFGIQDVTVSPTNIAARGLIFTNTTAVTEANLATLTTTTATAIVSATPAATATNFLAEISGLIEAPSNGSPSAITIMVSTAAAADLVTIRRGSHCRVN